MTTYPAPITLREVPSCGRAECFAVYNGDRRVGTIERLPRKSWAGYIEPLPGLERLVFTDAVGTADVVAARLVTEFYK